jgi:hypothetical protein
MDFPDDTSNDEAIALALSDFTNENKRKLEAPVKEVQFANNIPDIIPNTTPKTPNNTPNNSPPRNSTNQHNSNVTQIPIAVSTSNIQNPITQRNTMPRANIQNPITQRNTTQRNTTQKPVRTPTAYPIVKPDIKPDIKHDIKLDPKHDIKPDIKSQTTKKIYHIIDNQNNILNNLEYDIARANRLRLIGLQLIPQNNNADNQKKLEEKVNELIKKELEKKEKEKNDNAILEKVANLLKVKPLVVVSKSAKKKKVSKKKSKKNSKKSSKKKSKKGSKKKKSKK